MPRHTLILDLQPDPEKWAAYDAYHREVWPEVLESIRASGIQSMEIFRHANRLVMLVEVLDSFSWELKSTADSTNERVQAWEHLMWNYQQAIPTSKPGEKWVLMDSIFYFE
ncbi:MAG: L-rhamnose mutarotase [Chitinophagales bacterium]|jgi:L-rhamnose mutarotase